jgi:hypothetical protein
MTTSVFEAQTDNAREGRALRFLRARQRRRRSHAPRRQRRKQSDFLPAGRDIWLQTSSAKSAHRLGTPRQLRVLRPSGVAE